MVEVIIHERSRNYGRPVVADRVTVWLTDGRLVNKRITAVGMVEVSVDDHHRAYHGRVAIDHTGDDYRVTILGAQAMVGDVTPEHQRQAVPFVIQLGQPGGLVVARDALHA